MKLDAIGAWIRRESHPTSGPTTYGELFLVFFGPGRKKWFGIFFLSLTTDCKNHSVVVRDTAEAEKRATRN